MKANCLPGCARGKRAVSVGAVLLILVLGAAWVGSRPRSSILASFRGGPAIAAAGIPWSNPPSPAAVAIAAQSPSRVVFQRTLSYGSRDGELGMIDEPSQPLVGPESFAVARDGSILVADLANQKVRFYSMDGTYLRSLSVPGAMIGDVLADADGHVYVYDQVRRALLQYGADGTLRSTLQLKPDDIDTRGYFHLAGNSIYFADAAAHDVLVATLHDGRLEAPATPAQRKTDGVHGESGRLYTWSIERGRALRLEVTEPGGAGVRRLELQVPDIVSACYVGEDAASRFYVQTERQAAAGGVVVLEVAAFGSGGEYLASTRIPENDYALWTARLLDVGTDGRLVQFLPQRSQAKLNVLQ